MGTPRLTATTIFISALLLVLPSLAFGYQVTPTSVSLSGQPGDTVKHSFDLTLGANETVDVSSPSSWVSFDKTHFESNGSFTATIAIPEDAAEGEHSLSIKLNGNADISISLTVEKEEAKQYTIDLPNSGWLKVQESVTLDGVTLTLKDVGKTGGTKGAKVSLESCSDSSFFIPFGEWKNTTCSGHLLEIKAITSYESETTGELAVQFEMKSDYPYTVGKSKETETVSRTCDFQIIPYGSRKRGSNMVIYVEHGGTALNQGNLVITTTKGSAKPKPIHNGIVNYHIPESEPGPLVLQVIGVENCEPSQPQEIHLAGKLKKEKEEKKPKLKLSLPKCKPGELFSGKVLNKSEPLEGARVILAPDANPKKTLTNGEGKFFLPCPEKERKIKAEHTGFRAAEKAIKLKEKKPVEIKFFRNGEEIDKIESGPNVTLKLISGGSVIDWSGKLPVQIGNKTYTTKVDDGKGKLPTAMTGSYTVKFGGNDDYKSSEAELSVIPATSGKKAGGGSLMLPAIGVLAFILLVCVGIMKFARGGREEKNPVYMKEGRIPQGSTIIKKKEEVEEKSE